MSDDDKLENSELTTDDALLLRDEAPEPSSLDSDDDSELPAEDALLLRDDARESKELERLLPDLLMSFFELLEHAGTPKKITAATSAPTKAVIEQRTMQLF